VVRQCSDEFGHSGARIPTAPTHLAGPFMGFVRHVIDYGAAANPVVFGGKTAVYFAFGRTGSSEDDNQCSLAILPDKSFEISQARQHKDANHEPCEPQRNLPTSEA
jgi:hypothetical protein